MPAPKGNTNALGNSGPPPLVNTRPYRRLVANCKNVIVHAAMEYLNGDDEQKKFEIVKKALPYCFPKDVNLTGDGSNPVRFLVVEKMKEPIEVTSIEEQ